MCLIAAALMVSNAEAYRVTTADAGGADAELRESAPTTNRGVSTEIASRVASNRDSVIYLKFGVQDFDADMLANDIYVQTTYRNNNLVASRFQDLAGGGDNTGFDYFVLDPTMAGANWDELTITPANAPGFTVDYVLDEFGEPTTTPDCTTKGTLMGPGGTPTAGLTYLGRQLFDTADLGSGGHLDVGGTFNFLCAAGSALHDAIVAAQLTDHKTVTVIMGIAHEYNNANSNWINFNYLFNPKEMTTLNTDPTSPWSGMANDASNGYMFSPALTNVPEPATMALLGLGGLLLSRKRK